MARRACWPATRATPGCAIVRHAQNRGVTAAKNTGLAALDERAATFCFLDSDDTLLPDAIAVAGGRVRRPGRPVLAGARLGPRRRQRRPDRRQRRGRRWRARATRGSVTYDDALCGRFAATSCTSRAATCWASCGSRSAAIGRRGVGVVAAAARGARAACPGRRRQHRPRRGPIASRSSQYTAEASAGGCGPTRSMLDAVGADMRRACRERFGAAQRRRRQVGGARRRAAARAAGCPPRAARRAGRAERRAELPVAGARTPAAGRGAGAPGGRRARRTRPPRRRRERGDEPGMTLDATRPPRVLYLATSMGVGGAEQQARYLARSFRRRGWDVMVVSMIPLDLDEHALEAEGISVRSLGMRPSTPDPRGFIRLVRLLHEFKPDVLHSLMVHANLMARLARPVRPHARRRLERPHAQRGAPVALRRLSPDELAHRLHDRRQPGRDRRGDAPRLRAARRHPADRQRHRHRRVPARSVDPRSRPRRPRRRRRVHLAGGRADDAGQGLPGHGHGVRARCSRPTPAPGS